jgi:outer membrane PBP1 activator LpoA protein
MLVSFAASHPRPAPGWLTVIWLARLAVASLAVAAAFSAAQAPAASEAAPAAESGVRRSLPPANPAVEIAIVLPLDAPPYARAAEAVRAGFVAGAEAAGSRTTYLVIPHREDGVLGAFEAARKSGAKVIVGPLVRDDLRTVEQANLDLPWTLALNQREDAASGPIQLYTFSLTVESDARTIARRMAEDAAQNVVIVGGDTPLMKRFAGAFATEWLLAGGGAPNSFRFDPAPEALTLLKRELARKAPDAALLGVNGVDIPLVKPFLGSVTAYASGLVFDRKSVATLRDLDGLVIVEIPWLVSPGAPEFATIPRRDLASESLERLYALGVDAFRIAQAMKDGPPERFVLEGATGRVVLGESRQFVREGRLAVFRAGQLVPLDGAR